MGGRNRPQLGDSSAATDHDEAFSSFNPVQERIRILLKLL